MTLASPVTSPTSREPFPRYEPTRLPVRRFTVEEYHRLIEQGYFARDERFELLEGWIVAKMPRDPVHDAAVQIADEMLRQRLPQGWSIRLQSAITLSDSEPEPDIVIMRGRARDYVQRHPGPPDVALVVEVANTTLADDREIKGRVYARASLPLYWIINLIDRRVEVYSDPTGPGQSPRFRQRQEYALGDAVPLSLGGVDVGPFPLNQLLP